ncbi:MAG: hypothetical protein M0032_03955 [Actinomycetota bacterium]|jgi:hypothetical protein|nr:hypothetical protein [Actinomycetota bacterium]
MTTSTSHTTTAGPAATAAHALADRAVATTSTRRDAVGPGRVPWSPADAVAEGDDHVRGELSLCVGEAA